MSGNLATAYFCLIRPSPVGNSAGRNRVHQNNAAIAQDLRQDPPGRSGPDDQDTDPFVVLLHNSRLTVL